MLGLTWTVSPTLTRRLEGPNQEGVPLELFLLWIGLMLALLAGVAWRQQEVLRKSRVTRDALAILALTLVAQALLDVGFALAGFGMFWAHAFHPVIWALGAAIAAATVDWRFGLSAVAFTGGFLCSAWRPDWFDTVVGVTNAMFVANVAWMTWDPEGPACSCPVAGARGHSHALAPPGGPLSRRCDSTHYPSRRPVSCRTTSQVATAISTTSSHIQAGPWSATWL